MSRLDRFMVIGANRLRSGNQTCRENGGNQSLRGLPTKYGGIPILCVVILRSPEIIGDSHIRLLIAIAMSDATDKGLKIVTTNRQARYRFEILEKIEAGLVLVGTEVKSLRSGKCNLKEGYAVIDRDEAWLVSVHIPEYTEGNRNNHEPRRRRKLLMAKRQIRHFAAQTQQKGLTLVPLRLYFKGKVAKVELGLGRGKKLYDKRQTILQRDTERQMRRETFRRR